MPHSGKSRRRKRADSRPSAQARGYTYAWQKASKRFLLDNPTCARCAADAQVVDHIQPHRGDPVLFWEYTNWQALCKRCHDRKTARGL